MAKAVVDEELSAIFGSCFSIPHSQDISIDNLQGRYRDNNFVLLHRKMRERSSSSVRNEALPGDQVFNADPVFTNPVRRSWCGSHVGSNPPYNTSCVPSIRTLDNLQQLLLRLRDQISNYWIRDVLLVVLNDIIDLGRIVQISFERVPNTHCVRRGFTKVVSHGYILGPLGILPLSTAVTIVEKELGSCSKVFL